MGSLHDMRIKNSPLPSLAEAWSDARAIRLGTVEILRHARSILVGGVPVDLGGRAFDLLMVLIDAQGQIVTKEDLLARVWPSVTVIDSNLKVQLSLLRRALGHERWRVKTISGRGYLLVADDAWFPQAAKPRAATMRMPLPGQGRPLVIVVDADRDVQDAVMQALSDLVSDLAHSIDGLPHLAVIARQTQHRQRVC